MCIALLSLEFNLDSPARNTTAYLVYGQIANSYELTIAE